MAEPILHKKVLSDGFDAYPVKA